MIFVRDVMTRKVKTVGAKETIEQAAAAMAKSGIGSLVVVNGDKPIGIVTEGNISRAVGEGRNPHRVRVKEVMRVKLMATTPDTRLEEASRLMTNANVKKLPVLEKGKLVGIITQTDISASCYSLVSTLKELVRTRYKPPDFRP